MINLERSASFAEVAGDGKVAVAVHSRARGHVQLRAGCHPAVSAVAGGAIARDGRDGANTVADDIGCAANAAPGIAAASGNSVDRLRRRDRAVAGLRRILTASQGRP